MKKCIPVIISCLLSVLLAPGSAYGRIPLQERDALAALYNKTGGRNWVHQKNWNQAPGTESTWHGITCDANNTTVLKIELPNNRLQGVLPADLQIFANLTILDLSNNRLSGEIHRLIESFKNLKKLDLSNNDFSGPIPAWLGNLKNLEELVLNNNRLEGAIPKELGHLVNLKVLRLAGNRLTGDIPAELVRLVNLDDNSSDLRWNGLYTRDAGLTQFFRGKQSGGDWESTQTTAPSGIEAESTEDTITIRWQLIPYTAGTGGYRIIYREEGQPYDNKSFKNVPGKTVAEYSLEEFKKSTKYYFKICTWTDSHSNNKNRIDSPFSDERSMSTRGIVISGTIKNRDGKGVPGVLLTASNDGGTAETDKDGIYQLSVMPGWTGTITPFMEGFIFSPPYIRYDKEVTKSINLKDYTAESGKLISGTVTYRGEKVDNVILKFTGDNGKNYSALTDENGDYQQEVPYKWSGKVTPQKGLHGFTPKEKEYRNVTSSLEGQNYEVRLPTISGKVKMRGGKGVGGIKLKFSNVDTDQFSYLKDYAVTDEKGNYENDVLENWLGRVTPESSLKNRYFYFPKSIIIENPIESTKKLNFERYRNFKLFFSINSNLMAGKIVYPEITAGFNWSRHFYFWGRYTFIFKDVKFENWVGENIWVKPSLSFGIGYFDYALKSKNPKSEIKINLGIVRIRHKEFNNDKLIANYSWVLCIGEDYIFNITDRWFVDISFGFFLIEPGFISIGFGLGFRL
jgi:hypothetical protein